MNEAELRALIREAVARHLGDEADAARPSLPPATRVASTESQLRSGAHPSQAIYIRLASAGDACLIEPAVSCNHCGYCKTHGY